jgi:chromosome segregation ATPase
MNILFFLEPVIYRGEPAAASAHFMWVDCFRRAAELSQGSLALVSNADVCAAWSQSEFGSTAGIKCFELNAFEILSQFNFERARYSKAVFDTPDGDNPFSAELTRVRAVFNPDLVVMTSQNGFASRAFAGLRVLCVEQAPLPRLGHPLRTAFDPCGHQQHSIFELYGERIRTLPLRRKARLEAGDLLRQLENSAGTAKPEGRLAQAALADIQKEGPVALLVTQPTDHVTYEGAFGPVELEDLIYSWSQMLPQGWIGVPTYHFGQRVSEKLEKSLARSGCRLRFLPRAYSQDLTEPLLMVANGMITISSSSAMTGLLFRKRVVVTGKSPLSHWCESDPTKIASIEPLSWNAATSTLAFLTHRFSQRHDLLIKEPERLGALLRSLMTQGDPAEWLLDIGSWRAEAAAELFHFSTCSGQPNNFGGTCLRDELKQQLQDRIAEYESLKAEWTQAVAQRDRLDAQYAPLQAERDSFREEWVSAVADRDRRLHELEQQSAANVFLSDELRRSQADRDRFAAELALARVRTDAIAQECASALLDTRRLERALAVANDDAECAKRDLTRKTLELQAVADERNISLKERERLETLVAECQSRESECQRREAEAIAQRDEIQSQLTELLSKQELLEQESKLARCTAAAELEAVRRDLDSSTRDFEGQRDAWAGSARSAADEIERLSREISNSCSLIDSVSSELTTVREQLHQVTEAAAASSLAFSQEKREIHEALLVASDRSSQLSVALKQALSDNADLGKRAEAGDRYVAELKQSNNRLQETVDTIPDLQQKHREIEVVNDALSRQILTTNEACLSAQAESSVLLDTLQKELTRSGIYHSRWMATITDHGYTAQQWQQAITERDKLRVRFVASSDAADALTLKIEALLIAHRDENNRANSLMQRLETSEADFEVFRQFIFDSSWWRINAALRRLLSILGRKPRAIGY